MLLTFYMILYIIKMMFLDIIFRKCPVHFQLNTIVKLWIRLIISVAFMFCQKAENTGLIADADKKIGCTNIYLLNAPIAV